MLCSYICNITYFLSHKQLHSFCHIINSASISLLKVIYIIQLHTITCFLSRMQGRQRRCNKWGKSLTTFWQVGNCNWARITRLEQSFFKALPYQYFNCSDAPARMNIHMVSAILSFDTTILLFRYCMYHVATFCLI